MDWNGIEWERMKWGEMIWNKTGSGEQKSLEGSWVETIFAQPDASVDIDLLLPSGDLCCLFNVPLLWWLYGPAVQRNLCSLPLGTESLFVPNARGMGRGVTPPCVRTAVSVSGMGLGLGPSDYSALRLLTISCTGRVVFPRECCVRCPHKLQELSMVPGEHMSSCRRSDPLEVDLMGANASAPICSSSRGYIVPKCLFV